MLVCVLPLPPCVGVAVVAWHRFLVVSEFVRFGHAGHGLTGA